MEDLVTGAGLLRVLGSALLDVTWSFNERDSAIRFVLKPGDEVA